MKFAILLSSLLLAFSTQAKNIELKVCNAKNEASTFKVSGQSMSLTVSANTNLTFSEKLADEEDASDTMAIYSEASLGNAGFNVSIVNADVYYTDRVYLIVATDADKNMYLLYPFAGDDEIIGATNLCK